MTMSGKWYLARSLSAVWLGMRNLNPRTRLKLCRGLTPVCMENGLQYGGMSMCSTLPCLACRGISGEVIGIALLYGCAAGADGVV